MYMSRHNHQEAKTYNELFNPNRKNYGEAVILEIYTPRIGLEAGRFPSVCLCVCRAFARLEGKQLGRSAPNFQGV